MELLGAAQPGGERHELLDELGHGLADGPGGAPLVDDDRGFQPVACGPPLVLAHDPGPRDRQRVAAVDERVEALHQALAERRHHRHLAQGGDAIADAQLHGAEAWVGADVPPDLADGRDGPRRDQRVHEALELVPAGQLPRRPGGGQALEHLAAPGGQPGVVAHPVGARRRECQELRDVAGERVDHGHRLVAGAHADVHVDAEDLHLPRRPLEVVREALVARVGSDLLAGRVGEWMRAAAHQQQAARPGVLAELVERRLQIRLRLVDR